jgi:hypothetical protein
MQNYLRPAGWTGLAVWASRPEDKRDPSGDRRTDRTVREKIIMATIVIFLGLVAVGGVFASIRNFGKHANLEIIKLDIF